MGNKSGYYKYLRDQKLKENARRQFPEIYSSKIKKAKLIMIIASIIAFSSFIGVLFVIFTN
jgi:hypothetical protein